MTNSAQAAANAVDGDANTYWESANGAFPQWLQVDLGAATSIGKVTLKLPPASAWATRTQTLSVQTSTDGTTFGTVASGTYTFNPADATPNTAAITIPATTARYVRVNITANSGWPAGQVSELQVFPSGTVTPTAVLSATPGSLTFAGQTVSTTSAAQTVTVTNTGTAAATLSGVLLSGDFSQTNTCGTSLAVGASCTVSVKFTPTAHGQPHGHAHGHEQRVEQPDHGRAERHRDLGGDRVAVGQPVVAHVRLDDGRHAQRRPERDDHEHGRRRRDGLGRLVDR